MVNGLLITFLILIVLPLWRVVMTSFTPIAVYTKEGTPLFMWRGTGRWRRIDNCSDRRRSCAPRSTAS